MTGFTPEQAAVLRSLRGSWAEEKFVVIGATAIGCHLDFRWRKTRDLDLSIAAGIEECRKALERIPGWIRHERIEHEWTAPGNVRVDVIPANRTALESGRIDWPGGSTMSAVGLRAAFADNVRREVGDGLFVRVASATAITILKMAASLDRSDRDRDLSDLAYLMQDIVGVDDAERWSDPVLDRDLDYESVSSFLGVGWPPSRTPGRRPSSAGSLRDSRIRRIAPRPSRAWSAWVRENGGRAMSRRRGWLRFGVALPTHRTGPRSFQPRNLVISPGHNPPEPR